MFKNLPLKITDPAIWATIEWEFARENDGMELIASENYTSPAVQEALGSIFVNKYAEGFPGKRYYGGQEFTDEMETIAIERAKKIFHADHTNVQALSGAAANVCIYNALLEPGDTILGMDLSHGGHLTHGSPVTLMSKVYNFVRYKTSAANNNFMDYDNLREMALEHKPKLIIAGYSAHPRELDYEKFVAIGKEVGAIMMADVSHFGGLIAAGVMKNPLDYGFHVMMTTTHKTLRGPRGALILSKGVVSNPLKAPEKTIENIPTLIDRSVFPGVQGGPHMNQVAAIAVALHEADTDEFREYGARVLKNNHALAELLISRGYRLVTGGTDNNIIVIDFSGTDMDGKKSEHTLDAIGISTSKSTIPDDPNPPFRPSGLRLGLPAMTTRGIREADAEQIGDFIDRALKNADNEEVLKALREEVRTFCRRFPVVRAD